MKVSKKPVQRVKHVPQRTCVGCREVLPKRKMVRLVRTSDGVQIDPTGKLAGRGAYLHDRRDRARLEEFMNTLPVEAENVGLVSSQM